MIHTLEERQDRYAILFAFLRAINAPPGVPDFPSHRIIYRFSETLTLSREEIARSAAFKGFLDGYAGHPNKSQMPGQHDRFRPDVLRERERIIGTEYAIGYDIGERRRGG